MARAGSGYDRATVDSRNPIKRMSHRARFAQTLAQVRDVAPKTLLDYGAGTGTLAKQIAAAMDPAPEMALFEPIMAEQARFNLDGLAPVHEALETLEGQAFDMVVCQEVLEHLRGPHLENAVAVIKRMTRSGGTVLISVPIEVGPPALAKNLVRALMRRTHAHTTFGNVVNMALYRPDRVVRDEDDAPYHDTHMGFDHRTIPGLFADLTPVGRTCSPLKGLGPAVNSQATFLFRKP